MFPIELTPSNVFKVSLCGKEFNACVSVKSTILAYPNTCFTDSIDKAYSFAERPKSMFSTMARLPAGIFIVLDNETIISFKEDKIIDINGCLFVSDVDILVYENGERCITIPAYHKYLFGEK